MSRLFISHSSANNAEAVAIRDWLASEGWNEIFLDLDPERGVAAGERWERALNKAASRCEAVLFLISRNWLDSRWCLKEFNLARKLNKRLFGALIEPIPVADLPPDLTGAWQVVDLASGQDHIIFRAILPRTQAEAHVTFSQEGLTRLRNGLAKAGLDPSFFAWPPERDPDRPPYRGLKPLEAEDAGIFFGRDAPIVEALDTLRGLREGAAPRLLVILGASGAGKSSFLRAGLLPRLARDDRNFLPLPVIRPERAAISGETGLLHAIETALAAHGLSQSRASLRAAIAGGAKPLRPLLQQLVDKIFAGTLANEPDTKRPVVVLAIDQAEELFAGEGAKEGRALLELIRDLAKDDRPGLLALFTIRSDSYDLLETAKSLEGLRQQTLPLLPMPRGAYQTVIEGPAARLKETNRRLTIEPRLIQRLLEDIERGGGSDALPLLAFTLEQLYLDYGGSGALKLADYEASGGIRGAIEAAVQRALMAADNDYRIPRDRDARLALLRRGLIPWLAGIDPETGSPRRRVARRADIPAEAAPLIDLLVEQRLLATDRTTLHAGDHEQTEITIEPAHEALLRQWGLLHGWLEEDFAALTTLEGVKRAARDWAANARRQDWLNHAGTRLEDAEKVAARKDLAGDLSADARDYLSQCRAQEEEERREQLARLEREREERERQLRDAQAIAAANRRTTRRTRIGLVVAMVLAVLASGAAYYAKTQRDRAQQALTLATDTSSDLIFKIAQEFRYVAGVPAPLVGQVLEIARRLQDQLIAVGGANPDLQYIRAAGLIQSTLTLRVLGDLDGALAAARQAQAISKTLLIAAPKNLQTQHAVAVSASNVGDILKDLGKTAEALDAYREASSTFKVLSDQHPEDHALRRDLALSYQRIGGLLADQDKFAEAHLAHQESLAIITALVDQDPSNDNWQRELFAIAGNIASLLQAEHKFDEAQVHRQKSITIIKKLLAKQDTNTQWQMDLSDAESQLGSAMLEQLRFDEALAAFRDSLKIRKGLVASDGRNAAWQQALWNSYNNVGDTLLQKGSGDEALDAYEQGLALLTARDERDNKYWLHDMARSQARVAMALASLQRFTDSLMAYDKALSILKGLTEKNANDDWQFQLSGLYVEVGDVLIKQGDVAKALAAFYDGRAIRQILVAKNKDNDSWQFALSEVHNRIGDAVNQQLKFDEAIAAYQEALTIRKALAERNRESKWLHGLAVSQLAIAAVLEQQRRLADAIAMVRQAVETLKALVAAEQITRWQAILASSYDVLGGLLVHDEFDEALIAFRNGLSVRKVLTEKEPDNVQFAQGLAHAQGRIGALLLRQGKFDEAFSELRSCIAALEELYAKDARNTDLLKDLSAAVATMGDLFGRRNNLDGAITFLNAYLSLRAELVSILIDQSKPGEALAIERDRNEMLRRTLATVGVKLEWQIALAGSFQVIGDLLLRQDALDDALAAYRDAQTIRTRLVDSSADDAQRRALAILYDDVGDVLLKQRKLDDALAAYNNGLAILRALVAKEGANNLWLRDLGISYDKIAQVHRDQSKLDAAFADYRESTSIRATLIARDGANSQWQSDLRFSANRLGGLAYQLVLAKQFSDALTAADLAISIEPTVLWLYANRAHGLMYSDRPAEARAIYYKYRGRKIAQTDKPWEAIILEDFAEMRKAGLTHPLMDEIEKQFTGG